MELLEGEDLQRVAPLNWRQACAVLRGIASALDLIHSKGLLYRNLLPRNVRLTSNHGVKLLDFSNIGPIGQAQDGAVFPPFMSPELLNHRPLDQRSELFTFGALAYWLLTGRHAYEVAQPSELAEAWNEPPPPPSEVVAKLGTLEEIPYALDLLVLSLLSADPLDRPATVEEVMEYLIAVAEYSGTRSEEPVASAGPSLVPDSILKLKTKAR